MPYGRPQGGTIPSDPVSVGGLPADPTPADIAQQSAESLEGIGTNVAGIYGEVNAAANAHGDTTGVAVTGDEDGTIQQYLRGMIKRDIAKGSQEFQERVVTELKKINTHLGIVTEETITDSDVRE